MTLHNGWIVFYDGSCALCHGFVHFAVHQDQRSGLLFAPLAGETFAASDLATAQWPDSLPDSLIVLTPENNVLIRSDAVLETLFALGGFWRVLASISGWVPRRTRDYVYDRVAAARKQWFPAKETACPVVPGSLRGRFLP